jgi:phosphoribosylformylglycinamidine synthase
MHKQRGGVAPVADLAREMRLIDLLVAGRTKKIFAAAHDLSKGGLSATLTEMVLRYNTGATIQLEDVGLALLSESPGRVVVAIDPSQTAALIQEAATQKITLTKIGVSGGDALVINGTSIPLSELRQAHTQTFQKLFG